VSCKIVRLIYKPSIVDYRLVYILVTFQVTTYIAYCLPGIGLLNKEPDSTVNILLFPSAILLFYYIVILPVAFQPDSYPSFYNNNISIV
jgi:hypothetical protein